MLCLLPSLFFAVRAVGAAIHVRRPRASASMRPVAWAVEMCEFYKNEDDINLNIGMIYHPICEAMFFRNVQKAKWVDTAHRNYRRAIACLAVPVVGLALCLWLVMGSLPPPKPPGG